MSNQEESVQLQQLEDKAYYFKIRGNILGDLEVIKMKILLCIIGLILIIGCSTYPEPKKDSNSHLYSEEYTKQRYQRQEQRKERIFEEMDEEERAERLKQIVAKRERIFEEAKRRKPNYEEEKRKKYVKNNPQLSEKIKNCILNKEIALGMTKEQVLLSWGKSKEIHRTVGSWGVHEQWVYDKHYLYFENGILTSWQD